FKQVNDRFGHAAGDHLLADVAQRLRSGVRRQDLVARFGGDEFTILCRDATRADVEGLVARVAESLGPALELDAEGPVIGASIGVATSGTIKVGGPGDGGQVSAEGLIRAADTAMYTAKRRGGQRPGVRVATAD
ncbi:MAG: GGDEF domain-containing protein, partial [Micromonosporaceae bacterium]